MEKYFSPFLSAYRKTESSQIVLTSLIEEWKKNLDNGFVIGRELTEFSKAFGWIPSYLLIAKLEIL